MRRLDKLDGAIVNRRPGVNPTVDAEAVKYLMVEMIEEAGVKVFCTAGVWTPSSTATRSRARCSRASRDGRRSWPRPSSTPPATATCLPWPARTYDTARTTSGSSPASETWIGSTRPKAPAHVKPRHLGSITPVPGVNWVNMHGPEVDGLDVEVLTAHGNEPSQVHLAATCRRTRSIPGYDKVYLVETAPQLGVRITRVLHGLKTVTLDDLRTGTTFPDVVGVGGASAAEHGPWQIPYGALVPEKVDNVLAAGRCISAEMRMADLVRLIPNCFVTGHAAGVGAAVACGDGCAPRDVDVADVQKILREQEAYLG